MNVATDIDNIESFINDLEQNKTSNLSWDSPRYSPTHLNSITYIHEPYRQFVSEIYQVSHEQYCPPIPALLYNIDSKYGKFKSTLHSINIKQCEIEQLIKTLKEMKDLVIQYG